LCLSVTVENVTVGSTIAAQASIPLTKKGWNNGLLGYEPLEEGEGMVLVPCRQIHMVGMTFPIDVVFVDEEYRVIRILENIQPGEIGPLVEQAVLAVEVPVGMARNNNINLGDVVSFGGPGGLLIKLSL